MTSDNAFSSRMEDSSTPTMMTMHLRASRPLMPEPADAVGAGTMPGRGAAVTSILTFTT